MDTILENSDGTVAYRIMSSYQFSEEDIQILLAGRHHIREYIHRVIRDEPMPMDPNSDPSYIKTSEYLKGSSVESIFSNIGIRLHLMVYSRAKGRVLLDLIVGF